jgi:hypothetical protein
VILFEVGSADVDFEIRVVFGQAFLDLPPDLIVEPPVEIAADQQPGRDRDEQAPAEE